MNIRRGIRAAWDSFAGRHVSDDRLTEALTRYAAETAAAADDTARSDPDRMNFGSQPLPNPERVIREKGWDYVRDMERVNRTLGGMIQTRELAVTQTGWQVMRAGDDPRDNEVAEFVRRSIDQLPGSFDETMGRIFDAWRWGYSVCELVWGPWSDSAVSGEKWNVVAIKDKPPWSFEFRVDDFGNVTSLVQKVDGRDVDLDPAKFIIATFGARGWNPYGRGLVQQCFLPDWFLRKGWQFWAQYIERYVGGVTIGKYSARMKSAERSAFQTIIETLKSNAAITVPDDATVEYLTAASGGAAAYKAFCDEQRLNIAFTVTGSELVTMVGDSGSRALGDVHAKVNDRITHADAQRLFGFLNEQYVRRIVLANYGNVPMPILTPDTGTDLDRAVLSDIALAWHAQGLPVTWEWLQRTFDIDPPEEGETVLAGRAVVDVAGSGETLGGSQSDEPVDVTARFAATPPGADVIGDRQKTQDYIDRESTSLIDEGVRAGSKALDPIRAMLVERGRKAWEASNITANGRPKAEIVQQRPNLPIEELRGVLEQAIVGGLAFGAVSAARELRSLGVKVAAGEPTRFRLMPVDEVYAALESLTPITRDEWDTLVADARARAFTVSGIVEADLVSVFQQSLLTAISNGWSAEQWVASLDDTLRGWTDEALGTAPGLRTEAQLRTIFRTNVMRAGNDARLNVLERPSSDPVVLYMYMAVLDGRETDLCRSLHAEIAPLSQWRARGLVPPNHYNCRSYLTPILQSQVADLPDGSVRRTLPASWHPAAGFGRI